MSNIFEIQEKYSTLVKRVEELYVESEGEVTEDIEELEEALSISEEELKDKFMAYHYITSKKKSEVYLIDEEIKRLNNLKTRANNTIKRLEKVMLECVDMFGDWVNPKTKSSKDLIIGENKFRISYSTAVEVDDDFSDVEYIRYDLPLRLNNEELNIIKDYLNTKDILIHKEPEPKILKAELAKAIKNDEYNGEKARLITNKKYKG